MKVAIVHDWLNTKDGGAEKALRDILLLYPQADLFTLIYNESKFSDIGKDHKIITSHLQHYPSFLKLRPQFLLPFIQKAITKLNFDGYDLIISSSGAWSKNIQKPQDTVHICYCYSPARMLWDQSPKYLFGRMGYLIHFPGLRLYLLRLCSRMRLWDYYASKNVDQFIAISEYVAGRIQKFYGRDSQVVYPAIDVGHYEPNQKLVKQNYYLIIASLAKYKNIELAIRSCGQLSKKLVIVGEGVDEQRLKKIAQSYSGINFRGRVSDEQKILLLQQAKGLLIANKEDFGISPVESMAAGTPVIALSGGGASETVIEGVNGLFFQKASVEALKAAIKNFENCTFDSDKIINSAQQYDKNIFLKEFGGHVKAAYKK